MNQKKNKSIEIQKYIKKERSKIRTKEKDGEEKGKQTKNVVNDGRPVLD